LNCQRTMESVCNHCDYHLARNPGHPAFTCGSRKHDHRMSGSVKSIGLSTPWCSVR